MATIESLPSTFDGVTANFQFDKGMRVSSVEEYAECSMPTKDVSFDPARHLSHIPPSKVHTMKELEYPESRGVSQVGVSEPFPLFSTEAIQHMRREIFSDEVLSKYQFSSNLAPCQLRGFAQECAPFVYDAWKNPKTLEIISKIAGVDLLPVMDYEIGHVNISVNNKEKPSECLEGTAETTTHSFAKVGCRKVDRPVVGWHTDSYPFVCVTMLSDCKGMVGGETALKRGDGGILNVRGPQMVGRQAI
ncbi:hypothetical protein BDV59DRAFT_75232 [Aspergillus ambiguus]|uniref:uncharacterized protein n=1 Tax=Aspergillus ambiguus TaxID=176160 RepID=UPI003CCD0C0A